MNTRWGYISEYDPETSGRSWWLRTVAVTVLSGAVLAAIAITARRRER
jgi:hypothetical protein